MIQELARAGAATTGEDLARTMGVSRPTFHEHLRTAGAKPCRAFFGDRRADDEG